MPHIKFNRIVSCSSEDPVHPATNLLLKTGKELGRKWKCKEVGETSASVIIQFEESHVISGIDIGNESSSFVEVLVSRTSAPDDFKVILLMSSFMTPMDARSGTNRNRVRMFSLEDLCEPVKKEKWDRIKVVCTQPFSKQLQFGLSFLILHTPDVKKEDMSVTLTPSLQKLGRFALKEEEQSDFSVGSFFSRRKDIVEPPSQPLTPQVSSSGAAAIRDASAAACRPASQGSHAKQTNSGGKRHAISLDSEDQTLQHEYKKKKQPHKVSPSKKQKLLKKDSKEQKALNSNTIESSSSQNDHQTKENHMPSISYKPFNKLLEGVEFVISGYVNPGRAEIRDKALKMGAKYKPDWCNSSTHLICAFANTPKFQQVKGKGKIVFRDWIDECFKQRKQLPWRRFAVDIADKEASSSEPEVWESVSSGDERHQSSNVLRYNRNTLSMKDTRLRSDSNSDTDDEIERIKAKQVLKNEQSLSKGSIESGSCPLLKKSDETCRTSDLYEGSTDVDSEEEARRQERKWMKQKESDNLSHKLPFLPDFFMEKTFYLSPDLSKHEMLSLSRYIIAFGGVVEESMSREKPPQFVLTWKKNTNLMDLKSSSDLVLISPDWIWECNDKGKLVPFQSYELP